MARSKMKICALLKIVFMLCSSTVSRTCAILLLYLVIFLNMLTWGKNWYGCRLTCHIQAGGQGLAARHEAGVHTA